MKKKAKPIPPAWKGVIAKATRQLKARRFMEVLETLHPLGEDGMAHRVVSDLHCAALLGIGGLDKEGREERKAAWKRLTPEQRARERDEARTRAI